MSVLSSGGPLLKSGMRGEWWRLSALLLALAAGLAALRWDAWREVDAAERERLTIQVEAVERNLVRQLEGAYAALQAMRAEVESGTAAPTILSREMQALTDAMPGVRTLLAIDARGTALASNRRELVGLGFAEREYFSRARTANDPGMLHLSRPFVSVLGVRAMNLTLSVRDASGAFAGVVTSTLDASYFATAVGAGLYAADMWAAVGHEEGRALLYEPPQPWSLDADLLRPGTMFSRHLASGRPTSVYFGPTVVTGQDALMVLRTVRPANLPLDRAFVLAFARDRAAVHTAWRETTRAYALLWLLLGTGSAAALRMMQIRRRALDRERMRAEQQRRRDQKRLEMALHGADLGVWELDLVDGRNTVNARWLSMLGRAGGALQFHRDDFLALVHPEDLPRLEALLARHLTGESPMLDGVVRMRHGDGRWVWVMTRGQVTERDAVGKPLRMTGTHLDVTERIQAQQVIQDRERQLAAIADALPGPLCHIDREGVVLFANAACRLWLGHRPAAMLGQAATQVLGPLAAHWVEHAEALWRGEQAMFEAVVSVAKDTLYAFVTLVPDRASDGSVCGAYLVATDITATRRTADALRHSEARLRTLLDALATGVVVHDLTTRIVETNPAAAELLGLSQGQMQGLEAVDPAWHFIENDGSPMPLERYPVNQVMATGQPLRGLSGGIVRPDRPTPTWVLVDALPLHDDTGALTQIVITFFDITALRRADEQLRLLQAGIERLNDVVLITECGPTNDAPPRIVYANPAFERVTGYSLAEVVGRNPNLLQGPGTDRAEVARIGAAVRARRPIRTELMNYTRDGQPYWIEVDIVSVPDGNGRVTHMVAVERDVTERRETAERLRAAQEDLAATLAALPDLLFEIDVEGTILGQHSPRHDLLVEPLAQQIGKRVPDVLPPEVAVLVMQAVREAAAQGASGGQQYPLQLEGDEHWFELSAARKPMAAGLTPRVILLVRDISERHRAESGRLALEAQLREAQKHEAIGTLAGGIAHDFNNIVAGILGNVTLARQDIDATHPAAASLAQIERAGLRARSLVRQIMTFSRRDSVRSEPVALHETVHETLALLRATAPAGVRFEEQLTAEPVWVRGDATQLQQVLMNLCVNAWQALPERGGRITIGLARDHHNARLSVRDDGVGIDEPILARIFDPFFTTKSPGTGTGLGLAVVLGIVRSHGGLIEVASQPGQGTVVDISLPLAEAAGPAPVQAQADTSEAPGRGQTLLYVDDDEMMRLVMHRLLERAGWQVLTCSGGEEALAELTRPQCRVALLVSDMNMPDISGLDLCVRSRQLRPAMPAIISSGLVNDDLRARAAAAGVHCVVSKENLLEDLVAAVALALEDTAAAPGE